MTRTRCLLSVWAATCMLATAPCCSLADDRAASATATASSRQESGAERLEYTPPAWPEAPDTAALLLRLGAGTTTVLVLCVLTVVVSRRWLRTPGPKAGTGSELQVMESISLGNRCCVHLLRAGRHQLVVGVDGSGLKSLVALPESFEKSLSDAETHEAPYALEH